MSDERVFLRPPTEEMDLAEARRDLFDLVTQGQRISAREKARKVTEEQSGALLARQMRQAQVMSERFEWRPEAAVVLFGVQGCDHCGTIHTRFEGFGTLYRRKADPNVERISVAECLDRGLPLIRRELLSKSPACVACIDQVIHVPLPPPVYANRRRHAET